MDFKYACPLLIFDEFFEPITVPVTFPVTGRASDYDLIDFLVGMIIPVISSYRS
jgi:hypothetical protein